MLNSRVGYIHCTSIKLFDHVRVVVLCRLSHSSSDATGGQDEPDAPSLSLEEALRQLGLETLTEAFHKEQVDYDSLVSIK